MTTPICTDVREIIEAMRNAMVDLLFVWVRLVICLADAFCDDFRIAFGVAGVLAIRTLHAGRILEKVSTKRAPHNIVKLLFDELVALLLVHLFLLLANSTLSVEANIEWTFAPGLFLEAHREMDSACRFQRKPRINHNSRLAWLPRVLSEPRCGTSTSGVSRWHKRCRLLKIRA